MYKIVLQYLSDTKVLTYAKDLTIAQTLLRNYVSRWDRSGYHDYPKSDSGLPIIDSNQIVLTRRVPFSDSVDEITLSIVPCGQPITDAPIYG